MSRANWGLTFDEVTEANISRCNRWHPGGINDWTAERWIVAITGELGEAANALKKLFRIEDEIQNINEPDRQISTRQEAIDKIAEEIADVFIYLNLFACRLEIDLATEVVRKFNKISERYGFPERIGVSRINNKGGSNMVRCKFTCQSVTKRQHWDRNKGLLYNAEFIAVTDGSEENKKFFEATPLGKLDVGTFKEDLFVVGQDYYIDISPALNAHQD